VAQLSVGGSHLCVVDDSSDLYCGGWNAMGQVGNGRIDPPDAPAVQLTRVLSDVTSVQAASDHTCAIQQDGSLWCWGANDMGQVGAGDRADHATPTRVEGTGAVQSVAVGLHHTCAVGDDGAVWCWGSDEYRALGLGHPAAETCNSHRIGGATLPCASRPQLVL
jgi:alpha-tubulin suppressor-like RCC1 family protein